VNSLKPKTPTHILSKPILSFVDFFSGCGGMSYGFHNLAGDNGKFKWLGAFDNDPHANETYETNFGTKPKCIDLASDEVLSIVKKEILKNNWKSTDNLVVIGCAPCQGFSSHRKKDKRRDSRNSLVGRFADIAVGMNPAAIIMENVPDLLSEKHWAHFSAFKNIVESAGYALTAGIINMAEYGVPQERYRAVVIAAKNFIPSLPPAVLSRRDFKTVRQAIGSLPPLSPQGGVDPIDQMHRTSNHRKSTIEIIKKVPLDGGSRPRGVGPRCLDNVDGFYDVYGRLAWEKPSITITARCRTPSCGRFIHPEQHRGLSIREAALLQSFPSNFVFKGPFDDCYKQIGNAVPPAFSSVLAKHISDLLSGRITAKRPDDLEISRSNFKSYSAFIAHNKKDKSK
jgi:DNA (cytosine-5)-methyltransferase 1